MYIKIRRGRVTYEFNLKRSVSVIKGDSGSGKTLLSKCIADYESYGPSSGVVIECQKRVVCITKDPLDYNSQAHLYGDCIVIIDENVHFTGSKKVLFETLRKAGAWVVLISRKESVKKYVECAVDSVYVIEQQGSVRHLVPALELRPNKKLPDILYVEDTGSGCTFFSKICKEVHSLGGIGNFHGYSLAELSGNTFAIDLAILGLVMWDFMPLYSDGLFDVINMDSFESMMLNSPVFDAVKGIKEIRSGNNANAKEYYSWERYYTEALTHIMNDLHMLRYGKSRDPICFYSDCEVCGKTDCLARYNKPDKLEVLLDRYNLLHGRDYKELASLLPPAIRDMYSSDEEAVLANREIFGL